MNKQEQEKYKARFKLSNNFSTEIWNGICNNTSSVDLEINWAEIFGTFTQCIDLNREKVTPAKTIVLPAPTGTGKTLAMSYYASKLEGDTGVLIVTFLKDEVDKIEKHINQWSDKDKAVAFHSDSRLTRSELKNHQVLVITHKGLQVAIDQQNRYDRDTKIKHLYDYGNGKRQLVIIDEAIDDVISSELQISNLNSLLEVLESYKRVHGTSKEIKEDIGSLYALMNVFNEAKEAIEIPTDSNNPVPRIGQPVQIQEIRESLLSGLSISLEATQRLVKGRELYKVSSTYNKNTSRELTKIIDNINSIMNTEWAYYYHNSYGQAQIRTARSTQLENMSCVVLDATASTNSYYALQSNLVMKNLSNKVRTYRNVCLHISKDWRVGQNLCTKENSYSFLQEVVDSATFSNTKTAIFTHKKLRDMIETNHSDDQLDKIQLGHFGNLTGVNDYSECDTLYVFGIPYKPPAMYTDLHALSDRGLECLSNDKEVADERLAIEHSLMASEIVQMINRISCRNVIDTEGNCPDTQVYLTLPKNKPLSNTIISTIKEQMPHIVIKEDWKFNPKPSKKPGPISKYDELIIDKLLLSNDKVILFSQIVKDLEIKKGVQDSLRTRFKDKNHNDPLITSLYDHNIKVHKKEGSWVFTKE